MSIPLSYIREPSPFRACILQGKLKVIYTETCCTAYMWQISPDFISLVIQKNFFYENGIGMKFCIILYQKKECSCDTILLTYNLNLYFNAFSPCCAMYDSQGTDEKNLVIGQDLSHFLIFSIFLTTFLFDSEQCYYGENWMLITQVSKINIVTLFIVSSSEGNLWDCCEWAVVIWYQCGLKQQFSQQFILLWKY